MNPPSLRLLGPVTHTLFTPQFVDSTEVRGTVIVPLVPLGTYDLEVKNADGQIALELGAVEVVP